MAAAILPLLKWKFGAEHVITARKPMRKISKKRGRTSHTSLEAPRKVKDRVPILSSFNILYPSRYLKKYIQPKNLQIPFPMPCLLRIMIHNHPPNTLKC
jgi:hypothetical protein